MRFGAKMGAVTGATAGIWHARRTVPRTAPHPARWMLCAGLVLMAGTPLSAQVAVRTQHNDNGRTGANLAETQLTPSSVDPSIGTGMRLRYEQWAGGGINAQLLYVPRLRMSDATVHNVVFTPTTSNTVSAWDADTGEQLWNVTLVDGLNASRRPLTREGVFSTPVIDGNTLYVVYNTWNGVAFPSDGADPPPTVDLQFWLAKLDTRSGRVFGVTRIAGSAPSRIPSRSIPFVARRQVQRPGVLLAPDPTRPGVKDIYIGFGSRWHEEYMNYHGWVFRYDARTLAYKGCFCVTPNRHEHNEGAGIWQGGSGLVGDANGSVYFCTGNGATTSPNLWTKGDRDYGNSIVKLTPVRDAAGRDPLSAIGFDALWDDRAHAQEWRYNDIDLGSGGPMLIPGTNQVIGGGKTGILYLLQTADMKRVQKFAGANNTYVDDPSQYESNRYGDGPGPGSQGSWAMGPHLYGAPAFWQGPDRKYAWVYVWGAKDGLKAFRYIWGRRSQPIDAANPLVSHDDGGVIRSTLYGPGGALSLSANGKQNGVVWATAYTDAGGRLFAFDALTLRKLWEEPLPSLASFIPPTVADGRVFVPLGDGRFRVYELATQTLTAGLGSRITGPVPLGNPGPRVAQLLRRLGQKAAAIVPPDARALLVAPAVGTKTYVCQARPDAPGQWEWALRQTDETLIDDTGTRPGRVYKGRTQMLARQTAEATWEAHDESQVRGERMASVPAPDPNALPWLLWRRVESAGSGLLAPVTYIQRLETRGGLPTRKAGPDNAGKEVRVPYSAIYAFYGPASVAEDGGTSPIVK